MKVKVSEATGRVLDWMVALALDHKPPLLRVLRGHVALPQEDDPLWCNYLEHDDWAFMGPLMDKADIDCGRNQAYSNTSPGHDFVARLSRCQQHPTKGVIWYAPAHGPNRITAVARCFVRSKLGDEVEVPEELLS